jgi:hypothetical protein
MVSALALATSALDMGRPFLISFDSTLSTGASVSRDASVAKNFHVSIDPDLIDQLPLRGLYASTHNSVAHDYLLIQKKLGGRLADLQLNLENLVLRAREDLEEQQWPEARERCEQETIIASHLAAVRMSTRARYQATRLPNRALRLVHSIRVFLHPTVQRFPRIKKVAKRLLGIPDRPLPFREQFASIVDAAETADAHYASLLLEDSTRGKCAEAIRHVSTN